MWDLFLTAVNRCRSDASEKMTGCRPDDVQMMTDVIHRGFSSHGNMLAS